MKFISISGFALAMLTLTVSAAPTLVERSTLSDNTEVFSDAKAQEESVKEGNDNFYYGDFDYSKYLLSD